MKILDIADINFLWMRTRCNRIGIDEELKLHSRSEIIFSSVDHQQQGKLQPIEFQILGSEWSLKMKRKTIKMEKCCTDLFADHINLHKLSTPGGGGQLGVVFKKIRSWLLAADTLKSSTQSPQLQHSKCLNCECGECQEIPFFICFCVCVCVYVCVCKKDIPDSMLNV